MRSFGLIDYTGPLKGWTEPDWIGSWGMHVEAAAEEIVCMETNMFGNVGPTACIEPPKRPTRVVGQVGPSNVLLFESDQRGIASYGMSMGQLRSTN